MPSAVGVDLRTAFSDCFTPFMNAFRNSLIRGCRAGWTPLRRLLNVSFCGWLLCSSCSTKSLTCWTVSVLENPKNSLRIVDLSGQFVMMVETVDDVSTFVAEVMV